MMNTIAEKKRITEIHAIVDAQRITEPNQITLKNILIHGNQIHENCSESLAGLAEQHERSAYTLEELLEAAMQENFGADTPIEFLEHCAAIVAENAFHNECGYATGAELVVFPFEFEGVSISASRV